MKIKALFFPFLMLMPSLIFPKYAFANEKIEVIPLIQTSKGLSGESFNYLEGEPELILLKVKNTIKFKDSDS